MKIAIALGTLTKGEQYKLRELLLKAGQVVSVRKGTTKETKSMTIINLVDPEPEAVEEDLSQSWKN